ncbi:MAG: hypothetical protein IIA88_07385 [Bacteroidetes bacterium]|nr:hypothetical protein [Bacteroidota bacterium]
MTLNILDVQKFEETDVQLNLEDHILISVVQDALDQLEVLIKQKGLIVENKITHSPQCRFDFEVISRVIVNLLTNAIKYTPAGVRISLSAESVKEDMEEFIKISVSDTGAGIPADKLVLVFDKFSQVEAKKSGQIRSTGLGLTFCKLVVEAHKGRIWVESEEAKGTTFYFTLPMVQGVKIEEKEVILSKTEEKEEVMDINLSGENKAYLKSLFKKFEGLDVYDVSRNMELLNKIDLKGTKDIQKWKDELETAVLNCNEKKYIQLLALI